MFFLIIIVVTFSNLKINFLWEQSTLPGAINNHVEQFLLQQGAAGRVLNDLEKSV